MRSLLRPAAATASARRFALGCCCATAALTPLPLARLTHARTLHNSGSMEAKQSDVEQASMRSASSSSSSAAPVAPLSSGSESGSPDGLTADLSSHQPLLDWLSGECVSFPVNSRDVRLLSSPAEFYSQLLSLTRSAQRRVLLSSLYLGTGADEQALVEAIRVRMQEKPEMQVDVVLDYLRGTRPVGPNKLSSLTTLAPLMQPPNVTLSSPLAANAAPSSPSSSSQFSLHLLQVPPPCVGVQISAARAWLERTFLTGPKTREAVAVHHMKFYVFDEHTIISGANLSDTYFTTRQDRYILIRNEHLADFYSTLVASMKQLPFCHTISTQPNQVPPPFEQPLGAATGAESEWEQRLAVGRSLSALFTPRPATPADGKKRFATTQGDEDTWIFPTLQMGTLGITHDERITSGLFGLSGGASPSSATSSAAAAPLVTLAASPIPSSLPSSLDVATGYMNLTEHYTSILMRSHVPVRILAAGIDANGWYGATGGGKYVPELYAAAALEFLAHARSAHASSRVHLFEWHKASWSYHAKGLWLTLARASQPQLTMIGSPNFGARSVQRDTETALVMLTRDGSPLSHALAAEKHSLLQQCKLVTLDGHNPEDSSSGTAEAAVKPPMWVCALSKLARPYM